MIVDLFRNQLSFTDYTIHQNIEGVTHADSVRASAEGGNSLNWVMGHLLNSRGGMLRMLGGEPLTDEAFGERYGRGSAAVGEDAKAADFPEMVRLWEATHTATFERLDALDAARLAQMVPKLFDPEAEEPFALKFSTLVFHECYHAGQLGVIRRNIGKAGAIQ